MEPNKIVLNAITLEMVQDAVDYMVDEESTPLTEEEVEYISDELQDAVMDVITQFLNSRGA
jgi:hypothetical protein